MTHADEDFNWLWGSEAFLSLRRPIKADDFRAGPVTNFALAYCKTDSGPAQCSGASAPITLIGGGQPLYFICFSQGGVAHGNPKVGPDEARILDCGYTMEIRTADPLDTRTQGEEVSVYVTAAGTLTATPPGPSRPRISAAAVRKPRPTPLFRSVRKTAKRAGPVTFKLALSRSARATLARRRKLALTVRLSFKPKTGKTTTRTVKLTLRPLPKAPKLPKPPRVPSS